MRSEGRNVADTGTAPWEADTRRSLDSKASWPQQAQLLAGQVVHRASNASDEVRVRVAVAWLRGRSKAPPYFEGGVRRRGFLGSSQKGWGGNHRRDRVEAFGSARQGRSGEVDSPRALCLLQNLVVRVAGEREPMNCVDGEAVGHAVGDRSPGNPLLDNPRCPGRRRKSAVDGGRCARSDLDGTAFRFFDVVSAPPPGRFGDEQLADETMVGVDAVQVQVVGMLTRTARFRRRDRRQSQCRRPRRNSCRSSRVD